MSRTEQVSIQRMISEDKDKAARLLSERGYSAKTISRFLDRHIDERFLERRE